MHALNLRQATPADAATIVTFQQRLAEESEGLTLDADTLSQGVHAVFADPGKGTYWVAEQDGPLLACLLTLPEWSDWRNGKVLWIHSVYVIPEARRRGVFRALYQHLQNQVRNTADLRGLRLYVEKDNAPAQAVYQALGMSDARYDLFEWMQEGW